MYINNEQHDLLTCVEIVIMWLYIYKWTYAHRRALILCRVYYIDANAIRCSIERDDVYRNASCCIVCARPLQYIYIYILLLFILN